MNASAPKLDVILADPQSTRERRRPARFARRTLRAFAAVTVLVAAGTFGAWWITEGRFIESTDDAYVQGDIALLSPRIEGAVAVVLVADNQTVHANQPLILLDASDWQTRLEQANAQAAEASAAAETVQRQLVQQEAAIDAAQAAVSEAQAEQTRAAAEAVRSGTLVHAGWASRQANEQAIANAGKADAAVVMARAQAEAARLQLSVLRAQAAQAMARQQSAATAVRLAESNLSYTVIRAPFDGIVGRRAAEPGQLVSPRNQVIAVTPLRDKLYVVANFKETQLRHMEPGMRVRLIPDVDTRAAVEGRIESLSPATGAMFSLLPAENATGNFTKVVQRVPVKLMFDPVEAARATWLRAGLSVTAEVDTRGSDARRLGPFGAAAATLARVTP